MLLLFLLMMTCGACGYFAGYLMGVPVTSYSLAIGEQHVEFAEAKIQARIITRDLSDAEIDGLAVVAVAGKGLTTCSCRKFEVMWLGSPVGKVRYSKQGSMRASSRAT
jgi:hypothetical protein